MHDQLDLVVAPQPQSSRRGEWSEEHGVFRAGLPQGSVLSPTLFLLSAATLVNELRAIPWTSLYMLQSQN